MTGKTDFMLILLVSLRSSSKLIDANIFSDEYLIISVFFTIRLLIDYLCYSIGVYFISYYHESMVLWNTPNIYAEMLIFKTSWGEFISNIMYFLGFDLAFNDISIANEVFSIIGSHTAILGL